MDMGDWISIKDKLPEEGQQVIAFRPIAKETGDELVVVTTYLGGRNISPQGIVHGFECWCHPSHWMPIPEHPTETP